jgi:murein DD-endopeptidase MepM/ murein hydrolase activator NlpD
MGVLLRVMATVIGLAAAGLPVAPIGAGSGLPAATTTRAATAPRVERWVWPMDPVPRVVRGFERPTSPYGPGHRGVDLAGTVGQVVLTIGTGTVAFAGSVAGRGVVVIDHGRLSSTYQPVNAVVGEGDRVAPGQLIGFLELVGSHCLPDACLHLGVKHGTHYVDPLTLLPAAPVRLKPLGGLDTSLGPWMRLGVGAAQPFGRDVGVQLGGGQRGMAEDLLHRP